MLFLLAYWQGLAKLRLHTESTLAILDETTRFLGISLCAFKKNTCSMFQTKELPVEAAARRQREEVLRRKREKQKPTRHNSTSEPRPPAVYAAATSLTTRKGKEKEVVCEAVTGRAAFIEVRGCNIFTLAYQQKAAQEPRRPYLLHSRRILDKRKGSI